MKWLAVGNLKVNCFLLKLFLSQTQKMVSEYQVGRAKKSDGIWEREWSGAHEKVSSEFAIKSLSIPNSLHINFCLD